MFVIENRGMKRGTKHCKILLLTWFLRVLIFENLAKTILLINCFAHSLRKYYCSYLVFFSQRFRELFINVQSYLLFSKSRALGVNRKTKKKTNARRATPANRLNARGGAVQTRRLRQSCVFLR